ncbi:GIY-YIG nuclease family protein [Lysobacter sp.]|uniref:GIY-YIG nuclease family protein n=1 Tax=Lysobacter sp. TaxID=72226 RepID=UPI002D4B1598|nr:GIY-YIG nuclease family protein [Lysobacter sp.]HZX78583.1 GIY-YIG nuclease family protein [Lysobacter sp.]
MAKHPCAYILASRRNGTLYVGVTTNLIRRVHEHRTGVASGFTQRYHIHSLVWFEQHESIKSAIEREKAIKEWRRAWKLKLIESTNPRWRDLYPDIIGYVPTGSRPSPG